METVASVIARLPSPSVPELPAPEYQPEKDAFYPYLGCVGMAVESMTRNMTDEGFQIFAGLREEGYNLVGHNLTFPMTDTREVIDKFRPVTLLLQDKREWQGKTARGQGFDRQETFTHVEALKEHTGIFKGTIIKDAQSDPPYHSQSAEEIGCHFWVCYYHPLIVKHLAPYVRAQHLIRTYHTLDKTLVPAYTPHGRKPVLLSGALSGAYPLRTKIAHAAVRGQLPGVDRLPHPGYHRNGCHTPAYLSALSGYKVSICTASRYGYALRKIMESTACGCMVLTDLPADDTLSGIDGNLVRIRSDASINEIYETLQGMVVSYDPEKQSYYVKQAQAFYDYRVEGARLAHSIETLRRNYTCP